MLELLAALGRERAVWIGHDWGSPVVWNIASAPSGQDGRRGEPVRALLPAGFALDSVVPLVDRSVYPEAEYPAGQWEYQFFYLESFDKAHTSFEPTSATR